MYGYTYRENQVHILMRRVTKKLFANMPADTWPWTVNSAYLIEDAEACIQLGRGLKESRNAQAIPSQEPLKERGERPDNLDEENFNLSMMPAKTASQQDTYCVTICYAIHKSSFKGIQEVS